jgi:hypothetical protein
MTNDYQYGEGCTYANRAEHVAGLREAYARNMELIKSNGWEHTMGERMAATVVREQLEELGEHVA